MSSPDTSSRVDLPLPKSSHVQRVLNDPNAPCELKARYRTMLEKSGALGSISDAMRNSEGGLLNANPKWLNRRVLDTDGLTICDKAFIINRVVLPFQSSDQKYRLVDGGDVVYIQDLVNGSNSEPIAAIKKKDGRFGGLAKNISRLDIDKILQTILFECARSIMKFDNINFHPNAYTKLGLNSQPPENMLLSDDLGLGTKESPIAYAGSIASLTKVAWIKSMQSGNPMYVEVNGGLLIANAQERSLSAVPANDEDNDLIAMSLISGLEGLGAYPAKNNQDQNDAKDEQPSGALSTKEQLSKVPQLEVYIDPGGASMEAIQKVFESLSDLHRAAGGIGLDFNQAGEPDSDK